jgi:hypothetical protein
MGKPIRLRLSRKKGFNLQEHSLATNGLPAVNCARPSRWGNPFKVGVHGTAQQCVDSFRYIVGHEVVQGGLSDLKGKNLACYCKLDEPCHADVLFELANQDTKEV